MHEQKHLLVVIDCVEAVFVVFDGVVANVVVGGPDMCEASKGLQ
jgi:hypothetical protein